MLTTCPAHPETVKVLNCHASVIASDSKKGSPIFYQRFATFIKLFVKSGYDPGYLEGKRTPVTDAYWAFLKSSKDEVAEEKCFVLKLPVRTKDRPG